MKKANKDDDDDMLPEYDFSGGVRGKYAKYFAKAVNIVVLAPDVRAVFPNSEAVNKALRGLIKAGKKKRKSA